MKKCTASLCFLALAVGVQADIIQLNNGRTLSGRIAGYANDSFELQPTNAAPVQVPASAISSIDFTRGIVLATVELAGQKPLAGRIWLYARGVLNFDDDKGQTARIPLAKISRVTFSAEPVPERPAPPPRPKPAGLPIESSTGTKVEIISHGDPVDIREHCVSGKITIVDFYADWCGPCRSIGPVLEEHVGKDADLVLRKVDIVKWDSAVARQFGIQAIPFIQVYDRRGNKIGELTGFNLARFESLLSSAR